MRVGVGEDEASPTFDGVDLGERMVVEAARGGGDLGEDFSIKVVESEIVQVGGLDGRIACQYAGQRITLIRG